MHRNTDDNRSLNAPLLLFTGTEFRDLWLFPYDFTCSLILAEDKVIFRKVKLSLN